MNKNQLIITINSENQVSWCYENTQICVLGHKKLHKVGADKVRAAE